MDAGRKHHSWFRHKDSSLLSKRSSHSFQHLCSFLSPSFHSDARKARRFLKSAVGYTEKRNPGLREPGFYIMGSKPVWLLPWREILYLLHWEVNKLALVREGGIISTFQVCFLFNIFEKIVQKKGSVSAPRTGALEVHGEWSPNTPYLKNNVF